jgi:hypothetical protein
MNSLRMSANCWRAIAINDNAAELLAPSKGLEDKLKKGGQTMTIKLKFGLVMTVALAMPMAMWLMGFADSF